MKWLRKLFNEVVTLCFMMVGISPPKSAQEKSDLKPSRPDSAKDRK